VFVNNSDHLYQTLGLVPATSLDGCAELSDRRGFELDAGLSLEGCR
jgi:hypothetical protein